MYRKEVILTLRGTYNIYLTLPKLNKSSFIKKKSFWSGFKKRETAEKNILHCHDGTDVGKLVFLKMKYPL